jgi:hypothetical protein
MTAVEQAETAGLFSRDFNEAVALGIARSGVTIYRNLARL